jgi:predicted nucleic acid-binding protein
VILVDTSVWVEHLRRGSARLAAALDAAEVAVHPFVVGELACGRLRNRHEILALLAALPSVPIAEHREVLAFLEAHDLPGSGIGWVDAHLLASATLVRTPLWTLDRPMASAARALDVAFA